MSDYKKFIFPVVITVLGIYIVIDATLTDQTGAYLFGAFSILLAGLISLVAVFKPLSKGLKTGIIAALVALVIGLAYADYLSIKVPIEFKAEKVRRYAHVIQRLKDIRTAQLAFKSKYQKFSGNPDSLVAFVKYDSILFIRAEGNVPDTMSVEDALKAGIVSRDTNYVSVLDSLFTNKDEDRVHKFNPDSFVVVPFSGGVKFKLEAGLLERSGVKVPVFQATDAKPFDRADPMQVGSMVDPKTNGNWE